MGGNERVGEGREGEGTGRIWKGRKGEGRRGEEWYRGGERKRGKKGLAIVPPISKSWLRPCA